MLPDFRLNYKAIESKQYGISTKINTEIHGTKRRVQKLTYTHVINASTTEEARAYKREMTVSSISVARKTGELQVKEQNQNVL